MADVVIIGAGPAGIFAAQELAKSSDELDIVIVEQGKDIIQRSRSGRDMLVGWGGAGAYSDGKLTISTDVGGQLSSLLNESELLELLDEVDRIYTSHESSGGLYAVEPDDAARISARAKLAGLIYVPTKVRHIGTENCYTILKNIREELRSKVKVIFNTRARDILKQGGQVTGVSLEDGTVIDARAVIAAPGRVGSSWMSGQAKQLGLETRPNPVDLGVRVELPAVVMEDLTEKAYET